MQKVSPFLWFDGNAEEAVSFYVLAFKSAKVTSVRRSPDGKYFGGSLQIEGQEFMVLNGGPQYKFSPAVSFYVSCEDQAEIDRLWEKLCEGGEPNRCGWVTDKFGVTWQIVPRIFGELTSGPDGAATKRVFDAMMKMTKFNIAALERAYASAPG